MHHRIGRIVDGRVGAPRQLAVIAGTLLVAIINHDQHDQWRGEVRQSDLNRDLPPPESDRLTRLDGDLVIDPTG